LGWTEVGTGVTGRSRHSFSLYLRRRLGPWGGRRAWFNFFVKPFGATSFAAFWRQWNPVYGYYLNRYSYRPLSRIVGRRGAMFATFVLCGFLLHDLPAWAATRRVLPPGATIAFTLYGAGAVAAEVLGMDTARLPVASRVSINMAYLAAGIAGMLRVLRLTGALGHPAGAHQA